MFPFKQMEVLVSENAIGNLTFVFQLVKLRRKKQF